MNIVDELNNYIVTVTIPYTVIKHNAFNGLTSDEIISRYEPSNAVEHRYLDGSRVGKQQISYQCKSLDQEKCINQLNEFAKVLDLKELKEIANGIFIKVENKTLPVMIMFNDSHEYVFASTFEIEFLDRR